MKTNQMKIIFHALPQKQNLPSVLAQFPACGKGEHSESDRGQGHAGRKDMDPCQGKPQICAGGHPSTITKMLPLPQQPAKQGLPPHVSVDEIHMW